MDSSLKTTSKQEQWQELLAKVQELTKATSDENAQLIGKVKELEVELTVWKKAYSTMASTHDHKNKTSFSGEKGDVDGKDKNVALCVIDGTRNVFSANYINRGKDGGKNAGQDIVQGIADYLANDRPLQGTNVKLSITIYVRKLQLRDDLATSGFCTPDQFDEFFIGLNETPHLNVVEVCSKRDAERKMEEYLQLFAGLPQIARIIFSGGNGSAVLSIMPILESCLASDKLVILRSHTNLSAGTSARIPSLMVAGLFMKNSPTSKVTWTTPSSSPPLPLPVFDDLDVCTPPQSSNEKRRQSAIDPALPLHKRQLAALAKNAKQSPCWFSNNEQVTSSHNNGAQIVNARTERVAAGVMFVRLGSNVSFPSRTNVASKEFDIMADKSEDVEDFAAINTPGYKPAAGKTVDEYRNLDAEDESLARWKASLGLNAASGGDGAQPKLTVLSLELTSPTLPEGRSIKLDLTSESQREYYTTNPIQVKEGAPYKAIISYKVNHSIVTDQGARYVQVIKRSIIKVLTHNAEKVEAMLGSYPADPNPRSTEVINDDFPSGITARGTYEVRSKVVDLDGQVWLDPHLILFERGAFIPPNPPPPYRLLDTEAAGSTTWVDRLPPKAQPYLYLTRIDKPIGTLLLFYPCTWSITMASYAINAPPSIPLTFITLFGVGALIMRGAGCTINDLWDRNLDNAVERTKTRPLARGDITPRQAIAFLTPQLSAGLAVLTQLNWYSILLGASSLSLVITYPLMKRVTYWPQAVLGLAFNWGALLGWSAVSGAVHWPVAIPLYAGGVLWTLVYDSIYAHQDKADDVRVGIRSTALLFGEHTRSILATFSLSSIGCIALAGYLNAQGAPFFIGTGLAAAQLVRIVHQTDFNDRSSCGRGFVACGWAGFWVWMGALGTTPGSDFRRMEKAIRVTEKKNVA
ncbi:UbiA prenyltransferase family-domain-containing protein [Multifurca ochricompacta]|uniref:4-hydroxybenzoate polyprenyltransferase, mitochondrial n=1 Tax=Multifurca ochricompacta TaxID=376703 RepID=A0AAD4QSA5_9AGAM|nr:UbiA prenyltransferase family-domain-containing protein [Multifurca ochricompacta]